MNTPILDICCIDGSAVRCSACREKYHQFIEVLDETASSGADEELMEDDAFQSHKSTPVHPSYKDRTTINDFEIIKPISRGAFGRVCLARKRATGDLFAIKVRFFASIDLPTQCNFVLVFELSFKVFSTRHLYNQCPGELLRCFFTIDLYALLPDC